VTAGKWTFFFDRQIFEKTLTQKVKNIGCHLMCSRITKPVADLDVLCVDGKIKRVHKLVFVYDDVMAIAIGRQVAVRCQAIGHDVRARLHEPTALRQQHSTSSILQNCFSTLFYNQRPECTKVSTMYKQSTQQTSRNVSTTLFKSTKTLEWSRTP